MRAREEDIGGRASRRQATPRGMSLGAKIATLCGLLTLLAVGATIALSSGIGGSKDDKAEMDRFGEIAASMVGSRGAAWYSGASEGGHAAARNEKAVIGKLKSDFKKLWGEEGSRWWTEQYDYLFDNPPKLDQLDETDRNEFIERRDRFAEELERLVGGAKDEGKKKGNIAALRLSQVVSKMPVREGDKYRVMAAFLMTPGPKPKWVAGTTKVGNVKYDANAYVAKGNGVGHVDGKLSIDGTDYDVRYYSARAAAARPKDNRQAFVAVYEDREAEGGGPNLGMIMLLLGPLLVGGTAMALAGRHVKGLKSLSRDIDRLGSSGDPDRQLRAEGVEASTIARSVERMASNLYVRAKHDGDDLDEIVSREQKVAAEIHGALMSKNPPRLQGYEVETLFKPGFEIGGDHFDYFAIDDSHLGIILLDTNVRGVQAALVMSATKAYLRMAAPGQHSPGEVLKEVNRSLAGELPKGRHVTAFYVVLNTADGTATMASAGHLPLLVYRHATGKVAKVNPEGLALGLDAGPVFDRTLQEGDIPIGIGDRIVLYTDGALNILNEDNEEFGEVRFYEAVTREAPKNSQAFVNFLGGAIDHFQLDAVQNDDITISTIKRLR